MTTRTATVLLLGLVVAAGGAGVATAQDDPDQRQLNRALAVLRTRMTEASQPCLRAMKQAQDTEQQVENQEHINPGDNGRPNPQLDIARDVLGSDYETANAACTPDAQRVCSAPAGSLPPATARACSRLPAAGTGANGG